MNTKEISLTHNYIKSNKLLVLNPHKKNFVDRPMFQLAFCLIHFGQSFPFLLLLTLPPQYRNIWNLA